MLGILNNKDYGITNRIRELRAKYSVTQDGLAQAVGVTRQTILFIENGKYNPSLMLGFLIAEYFGVSISEVFALERKEVS